MHAETIAIHRTFRVMRHQWKGRKWTEFGFEAPGRTIYSARVYGHPDIRETMHVTVVLPRENAWSSICGWLDHRDESIQIEGNGSDWGFVAAFLFGITLSLFGLMGRDQPASAQVAGFSVILCAQCLALLFFGVRLARKLRAASQLRSLFPGARQNAT